MNTKRREESDSEFVILYPIKVFMVQDFTITMNS